MLSVGPTSSDTNGFTADQPIGQIPTPMCHRARAYHEVHANYVAATVVSDCDLLLRFSISDQLLDFFLHFSARGKKYTAMG